MFFFSILIVINSTCNEHKLSDKNIVSVLGSPAILYNDGWLIEHQCRYFGVSLWVMNMSLCVFVGFSSWSLSEQKAEILFTSSKYTWWFCCFIATYYHFPLGKAARDMYFRVMALEYPDVRVITYCPGFVNTEMLKYVVEECCDPNLKPQLAGW